MIRRFAVGVCFALVVSAAGTIGRSVGAVTVQDGGVPAAGRGSCAHLPTVRLPDVTITEATAVPAATTGSIRAAHCRVAGVIGTEIRFALLLPDNWNQKFLMGGGGGYVGTVQNQARNAVDSGYATAGTDTGHQGGLTDASWALDNLERRVNFGYLSVHRTAETAKAIVRSYYGRDATRSYFGGCSRGGGQGLMEAQRFPDDFDGIVAGAPAYDWTGFSAQMIREAQAVFPDPRALTPMFSAETLKSVESQILDACDAMDGVKDGVIDDPRQCTLDVKSLKGLTDAQRAALSTIYSDTRDQEGLISPAQPFGGEGQPDGWPLWITGPNPQPTPQGPTLRFAFATQFYKYLVFNDPAWDYSRYNLSSWRKDTRLTATFMDATSPNLDAFKSKGHKLVVWHGWSDPALTALASIRYYEQVQARDAQVRDYFRTFLLPGVLHCGAGPGPDTVDWTAVIANWVEHDTAPDRIVARKLGTGGTVTKSRPLCPYPQRAVYAGRGSTDDAANFICKAP